MNLLVYFGISMNVDNLGILDKKEEQYVYGFRPDPSNDEVLWGPYREASVEEFISDLGFTNDESLLAYLSSNADLGDQTYTISDHNLLFQLFTQLSSGKIIGRNLEELKKRPSIRNHARVLTNYFDHLESEELITTLYENGTEKDKETLDQFTYLVSEGSAYRPLSFLKSEVNGLQERYEHESRYRDSRDSFA